MSVPKELQFFTKRESEHDAKMFQGSTRKSGSFAPTMQFLSRWQTSRAWDPESSLASMSEFD